MALMWKRFLYARRSRKGFFAQVVRTTSCDHTNTSTHSVVSPPLHQQPIFY